MRTRTLIARLCLAASAAVLVTAVLAPGAGADDPDAGRPTSWDSRASSNAIGFQLNSDPLLIPFPDLVRLDIAEGDANWSAFGEARGRASTLWPGSAVINGLPALCENGFPCPPGFPPEWRWSTTAEGSETDTAAEDGGGFENGPFRGRLHRAEAHADREYVETNAVFKDFVVNDDAGFSKQIADNVKPGLRQAARQLDDGVREAAKPLDEAFRGVTEPFAEGGLPILVSPSFGGSAALFPSFEEALDFDVDRDLVRVESVKSTTRQEFVDGVLQSRSEAVLSGVKLFGGLVRINEVRASAVSRTDGALVSEVAHDVEVGQLTVANVPAGLNSKGVVFGARGVLAGNDRLDLDLKVQNVLGRSGLEIRLGGTDETLAQGNVSSSATGVLVHVEEDAGKVPGVGAVIFETLTLGVAGTRATVAGAPTFGDFPVDPEPGFGGGGGGTGTEVLGGDVGGGGGFEFDPEGDDFNRFDGGDNVALPPAFPPATQGGFGSELLAGLVADRLTLFYLAWTLAMVFLALGSRRAVPRLLFGKAD